ncbi:hypothetical protein KI387_016708, partial [Taxus chinensis]
NSLIIHNLDDDDDEKEEEPDAREEIPRREEEEEGIGGPIDVGARGDKEHREEHEAECEEKEEKYKETIYREDAVIREASGMVHSIT